jgi:hypothetical protein
MTSTNEVIRAVCRVLEGTSGDQILRCMKAVYDGSNPVVEGGLESSTVNEAVGLGLVVARDRQYSLTGVGYLVGNVASLRREMRFGPISRGIY